MTGMPAFVLSKYGIYWVLHLLLQVTKNHVIVYKPTGNQTARHRQRIIVVT